MKFLMALMIALVPTASFAKGECKADKHKFCKHVIAAKGDVGACLNRHMAELSEACKSKRDRRLQAPVRKVQEATKVSSLQPPPLPLRKPQPPMKAKFEAAQAKAKVEGVHTLTQEDIKGLSLEQIKELRGY
jgi:hypothetical protein